MEWQPNSSPVVVFEPADMQRKDGGSFEPPVVVVVVTEKVINKAGTLLIDKQACHVVM